MESYARVGLAACAAWSLLACTCIAHSIGQLFSIVVTMASGLSDSDSDPYCTDVEECPGPSKRLKVNSSKGKRGAAQYRTKFQIGWRQKWPFAVVVKNNPHSFCCTMCNKVISCGHQGERDLSRHADTATHKHNLTKSTSELHVLRLSVCTREGKLISSS